MESLDFTPTKYHQMLKKLLKTMLNEADTRVNIVGRKENCASRDGGKHYAIRVTTKEIMKENRIVVLGYVMLVMTLIIKMLLR